MPGTAPDAGLARDGPRRHWGIRSLLYPLARVRARFATEDSLPRETSHSRLRRWYRLPMWIRGVSSLVASIAVLWAGAANAQVPSGSASRAQTRLVSIRGDQGQNLSFEIHAESDDGLATPSAFVACRSPCQVALSPGSYQLKVAGSPGSDIRAGEIPVQIDDDSEVVVKTTSESRCSLSRKVGIAGSAVAGAGATAAFLTVFATMGSCSTDDCRSVQRTAFVAMSVSLGVVAVGGATALLGWITFARNNAPAAEVRRSSRPTLSGFGLLRTEAAWGVSAAAAF